MHTAYSRLLSRPSLNSSFTRNQEDKSILWSEVDGERLSEDEVLYQSAITEKDPLSLRDQSEDF